MDDPEQKTRARAATRGQQAEAILAELFRTAGWKARRQRPARAGAPRADLIVRRDDVSYAVEVKVAVEGRGDRLIPLWSQAYLQARRVAGAGRMPLAVVAAPRIAPRVATQVLAFAAEYAPGAAVGVIDFAGLRRLRGPLLDGLDAESLGPATTPSGHSKPAELFSDLNQWLLKVLVAPELPESLLSSPRGRYRNVSELARAATVSVMSAFRFVQQLQRDGHLHESAPHLQLVRREELFRRWQAWAAAKRVKEVPMRFLLDGDPQVGLTRMLRGERSCLALVAAADALGVGFVHGVPPHVYVPRFGPAQQATWKHVVVAGQGEAPDVIVREAPAPQSVFRGLVQAGDRAVSDIIQVWLDVASHPSRGAEQAEQIRRRVLAPVIEGERASG